MFFSECARDCDHLTLDSSVFFSMIHTFENVTAHQQKTDRFKRGQNWPKNIKIYHDGKILLLQRRSKSGLVIARPAGHMRPAKHLNVTCEHLSKFSN